MVAINPEWTLQDSQGVGRGGGAGKIELKSDQVHLEWTQINNCYNTAHKAEDTVSSIHKRDLQELENNN